MWFSPFTEPTAITSPAGHLDVTVGESIVLPCQVSHDPTLDLKFTWFFNEQLIHFGSQWAHFEKVGGVSAIILSAPFVLFYCNLVSVYFDYFFGHCWHVRLPQLFYWAMAMQKAFSLFPVMWLSKQVSQATDAVLCLWVLRARSKWNMVYQDL